MLTLLTATGCRPIAWAVCQRLMAAQGYSGRVRWVIVDDGEKIQPVTIPKGWQVEIVRPTPFWKPGQNTQARNLLAGLEIIEPTERVVIIEDDDYYSPDYLSAVDEWLNVADLVGESHAVYYNVATGRQLDCENHKHSSLCSTAVKGDALTALRQTVSQRHNFIDMHLWKNFAGSKQLFKTSHVTGIKGLPGRDGIGCGHRKDIGKPADLKNRIGEAADIYKEL